MTLEELIEDWHRRAEESQFAHYEAAKRLTRLNYILGVPVVIIAAVVGASIFSSLQQDPHTAVKIVTGLLSLLAASLAALQTFLKFEERAEKHRLAGAAYGAIRRELQQAQTGRLKAEDAKALADRCRTKFDELAQQAPAISEQIWKATERVLAQYEE